ncbi:(S)-beta-bisabolene synthase [Plakobranchus ocellatus]|uniref:(S)-beta-bisabolene synthase n=1 Tax=Plakobranchus ocellatus TaxID=259542 RepID=A0AAV4AYQ4_9GAST|nr:(S)-beta-bisabolene synthase [Plakobranchus ocellatus]
MEPLNVYLKKKPEIGEPTPTCKISNVEELVKKTLCKDVKKECIDRKCGVCDVSELVEVVEHEVGSRMENVVEWKRWEKTDVSSKDLVMKKDSVRHILNILEKDLFSMGKHLHTAHWQRKQYQLLRDNLVERHCLITAGFAENYLCKFQNEVESAHCSYKQVR